MNTPPQYRLRAHMAESFEVGPATVQSGYAPGSNANSAGDVEAANCARLALSRIGQISERIYLSDYSPMVQTRQKAITHLSTKNFFQLLRCSRFHRFVVVITRDVHRRQRIKFEAGLLCIIASRVA